MIRLGGVRLLGLVLVAAGLLGATATGAAAREDDDLRVTAEGVAFDRWDVSRGATLEYTVSPVSGQDSSYFRRGLTSGEWHAEWVALYEAAERYPDGYCVTWLRLDREDWGPWMSGPACWEPAPAPVETDQAQDEPADDEPAEPTPEPEPAPAPPEATTEGVEEPESTLPSATPSPTPEPTPSPSEPSPSPSAEPEPVVSSNAGDPARAIIRSFGPVSSDDDTSVLRRAAGLPWAWAVLAGFAAAAGGALLMMFRRPP